MHETNLGGFFVIGVVFGTLVLIAIPAMVKLALTGWAEIVECYWRMRLRVMDAPSKAEREAEEKRYARR